MLSRSEMCVRVVRSVRSSTLHDSYRTAEDRPGEILYLVHNTGAVTFSVESEWKQTRGLYAVSLVRPTIRVCPADLGSDLGDVALTFEAGRVRVSRLCEVHLVLSCHPGQVAGQLRVDGRVLGGLVQL